MAVIETDASRAVTVAFEGWLQRFGDALAAKDISAVLDVFEPTPYWKDILALSGAYRTYIGQDEISTMVEGLASSVVPVRLRQAAGRTPPRLVRRSASDVIEAFFDFDTEIGRGTGFVRLRFDGTDPSDAKAWIVLTALQELHGYEEAIGGRRPTGVEFSMNFSGDNWLDKRRKAQAYALHDPEVLIVGGGQSGLILAARLRQMGADALVIERLPRIGDNWRNRYHSLTLHNEVWANNMPYMPFPETWPTFLPKDMVAGWLEAYAESLELNVWTETELVSADYDEDLRRWSACVRRPDGSERTFSVPHLVLATGGVSGVPNIPAIPGLDSFEGEVLHSSAFRSGIPYQGKRAIVIGTGNSGHDVAQDLQSNGAASVTMVQRGPTCVVSLVPSGTMVYSLYSEGPPVDDIDLITAAIPYPVLRETYQWLTKRTCELDAPLLRRLNAAGFETDFGEDETGFHMMYLRTGGGYYINVGCSDLIADGKIGVVQSRDMAAFTPEGLLMQDGRELPADLVVLATGYENQQEGVRRLLGDEIADKVGPVWGFDENYVMRNMWQRTAQPGLWIMGGSLVDCRLYSRFLALLIRADLADVSLSPDPTTLEHSGRPGAGASLQ